jgi:hypothetical protein
VAGHDRQVGAGCAQPAGIALDPQHPIAVWSVPGDVEHPRRRVDPDHPVTPPGQLAGDEPRTAAEIDDRGRAQL